MVIQSRTSDDKSRIVQKRKVDRQKSNEVSVESDFKEGLSQQCIDFYKELDELSKEIDDGKGIKVDVNKLAECYGL
jgi:signal transduction histidine kinase